MANVYCGQTGGWMKTPVGTEVDLSPGHNVLAGVPSLRETGTAAPIFSARVYCGHGRPSQLLLSSCCTSYGILFGSVHCNRQSCNRYSVSQNSSHHVTVCNFVILNRYSKFLHCWKAYTKPIRRRPLLNAAKFGWRPLLECRAVTLPRRETH